MGDIPKQIYTFQLKNPYIRVIPVVWQFKDDKFYFSNPSIAPYFKPLEPFLIPIFIDTKLSGIAYYEKWNVYVKLHTNDFIREAIQYAVKPGKPKFVDDLPIYKTKKGFIMHPGDVVRPKDVYPPPPKIIVRDRECDQWDRKELIKMFRLKSKHAPQKDLCRQARLKDLRAYKFQQIYRKKLFSKRLHNLANPVWPPLSNITAIRNLLKRYVITPEVTCNTTSFKKAPYQIIASRFLHPRTPYRGVLVYHGLGSGKTCTAVETLANFYTEDPSRKIIVVVPPALKANFLSEMKNTCPAFKERFASVRYKDALINKMLDLYSYITFANRLKRGLSLKNTLVIVDEAHNLVDSKSAYRKSFNVIREHLTKEKDLRVMLMTATPAVNDPWELAQLANIIDPGRFKSKKDLENPDFTGIASHYDTESWDTELFAPKIVTKPIDVPATNYIISKSKAKNLNKQQPQYIMPTANAYATKINQTVKELNMKAPKIKRVIENLSTEQKNFVFSQHKSAGVNGLAAALKAQGWKQITPKDRKYTSHKSFMVFTTDRSKKEITSQLEFFNRAENWKGEMCKVLIADKGFTAGISLQDTFHVHLLEAPRSITDFRQIIGRAIRRCSHKRWPMEARKVTVYQYWSGPNSNIYDRALKEIEALDRAYAALKKGAVDRGIYATTANMETPKKSNRT